MVRIPDISLVEEVASDEVEAGVIQPSPEVALAAR